MEVPCLSVYGFLRPPPGDHPGNQRALHWSHEQIGVFRKQPSTWSPKASGFLSLLQRCARSTPKTSVAPILCDSFLICEMQIMLFTLDFVLRPLVPLLRMVMSPSDPCILLALRS